MQKYALIVAGGVGKRMGSGIPKQFLELAGKPILMHSAERFVAFDKSVNLVIVLNEDYFGYWNELVTRHSFSFPYVLVKGGPHRFFSVKNGLEHVPDGSLVAIHDGVRPLVSKETIGRCFDTAEKFGNAVPAIIPSDSLRVLKEKISCPVNREYFKLIQTPQVFHSDLIRKAYLHEYSAEFTDDATVLETTGEVIHLVEGNRENIKITNPEDLLVASALLPTLS